MTVTAPKVLAEDRFRCMGSDAHIVLGGADAVTVHELVERARARLGFLERTWSRFLPDSEVSVANAAPGTWHAVSSETVALVRRALAAWEATGGRFDPMLLHDVVAAGYATTFDPVDVGPPAVRAPGTTAGTVIGRSGAVDSEPGIDLDELHRRIRVHPGFGFDPGGIGKGFAADLVVGELLDAGATGVCVNVGGDLRMAGSPPVRDGDADGPDHGPADTASSTWIVDVEDPRDPAGGVVRRLSIADGGVATSSRCRRRWRLPDGTEAHHLIDPSTGEPAAGDVLTATVVASQGWIAEALATAVFLARAEEAHRIVERWGATGVIMTSCGVIDLPGLDAFVVRLSSRRVMRSVW